MKKTPLVAALIGSALIAGLAGCTADKNDATPTSTPSDTKKADAPKAVTGKCVDGFMLVDASTLGDKPTTVAGDCDTVSIVGTGGTITLGNIAHLYFEGNSNKVTAGTLTTVAFSGSKNTLTHTGAAPTVDDQGTENTVTAR